MLVNRFFSWVFIKRGFFKKLECPADAKPFQRPTGYARYDGLYQFGTDALQEETYYRKQGHIAYYLRMWVYVGSSSYMDKTNFDI